MAMNSHRGQAPRRVPGAPPEMFEEWNGLQGNGEDLKPSTETEERADLGDDSVSQSLYEGAEISMFGPRYGLSQLSNKRAQDFPGLNPAVMWVEPSNSYEDIMRNADADLERLYLDSLESAKGRDAENSIPYPPPKPKLQPSISSERSMVQEESAPATEPFIPSITGPTSCIICTDDFSATVRPPAWVSLACLHEPSICSECLAKCIASDLENKIWNQIKCPECKALLIYEDIRRLANPETLARYELISFRSAVSGDDNFVWCRGCDFGQLHESGASQPIIRCLNCGFRSCFVHSVPWHEQETCEEYDEMLRDPDRFQSVRDKENEAVDAAIALQNEEDERLARELDQQGKRAEQVRQQQRHEEERRRARAAQEAEARRKQLEHERAKVREELKRKQREEKMSLDTIKQTTKRCPQCEWPIEKNEGCEHMTCTKCRYEFCWRCKANWKRHGYGTRCAIR